MRKFISVLVLICLTLFIINLIKKNTQRQYDNFFKNKIIGVIDSLRYGTQTQTIIVIDNEEFNLSLFGVRKRDGVMVGDSIYKKMNSKVLELHSKSSNGYIYTHDFELKK